MKRIDLNSDVGESFGPYKKGEDEGLLPYVTSANVACGFHSGDPSVMRKTVGLAVSGGVALGAHPGFSDLMGFGRRELGIGVREIEDIVVYQIGALAGVALAQNAQLQHVKPHGALYNMAARDRAVADAVVRAILAVDDSLILFGLSGSLLLDAGEAAGLRTAAEVFADRAYLSDGSLVPRDQPDAVIVDPTEVRERALRLVEDGSVVTQGGDVLEVRRDTICIHGDTPAAGELAAGVRSSLENAGIQVISLNTRT